jgi:hypothetical protein
MKKILSLLFVFIVFLLFCLIPIQHPLHLINPTNQASILEDTHIEHDTIVLDEKTNHNYFPEIPSFIFVFLILTPLLFKIIQHIHSIIPILKLAYLLFPVKYKSRYLVKSPFISI